MFKADAFAKDMCDVLNPHPVLKFEREHPKKGIHGCVDVVGKDKTGKTRVLIEVELRRYSPVTNVLKVWQRLENAQCEPDIILFQAFSDFYSKKASAKKYAEFVAEKM